MAGKVKIQCFDKTGTLTKDELDIEGCQGVVGGKDGDGGANSITRITGTTGAEADFEDNNRPDMLSF